MKIAIQGCCHGELDKIYASVRNIESTQSIKVDLLIICGDFQSMRNMADLRVLACPEKYRQIGTFYKYYSGEKVAPYPTIFIGGNHEASNYLWELFHGGWVAPNIYFMGFAGCIRVGDIRIGGLSGIFKPDDYECGFYERQPFNDSHSRSIYHVRRYNIYRLLQLTGPMDIFMSHDWPRGIAYYGNHQQLTTWKPFLLREIQTNTLGSPPGEVLLHSLQPKYWFSAHLHVKFAALVNHEQQPQSEPVQQNTPAANPDEIALDFDDEVEETKNEETEANPVEETTTTTPATPKVTRFLSLDKCLPGREFLQIIDIPAYKSQAHKQWVEESRPEDVNQEEEDKFDVEFCYDREWLAIMKATAPYLSFERHQTPLPNPDDIRAEIDKILETLPTDPIPIPQNFSITSPPHNPSAPLTHEAFSAALKPHTNPQTVALCELIGMQNVINP